MKNIGIPLNLEVHNTKSSKELLLISAEDKKK